MLKKRLVVWTAIGIALASVSSLCFYIWEHKTSSNELVLYGNVDVRQVDISFRVPGLVTELKYEEGDLVKKGELMAVLDKTPYDSQVEQASASVKAVMASFQNAEILLKRRRELITAGGISQEDLDNAKASRDQLLAQLHQAEAQLKIAKDNLEYTEAYAPTEGVILTRVREPGTVIEASNPVYTLSVASPVWIRAYIDEPYLGQVDFGMAAEVTTDTPGGKVYQGKVGFISPIAEFTPKTVQTTQLRTDLVYRLRIYVDNSDQGLKQGMPVTVKLIPKKTTHE